MCTRATPRLHCAILPANTLLIHAFSCTTLTNVTDSLKENRHPPCKFLDKLLSSAFICSGFRELGTDVFKQGPHGSLGFLVLGRGLLQASIQRSHPALPVRLGCRGGRGMRGLERRGCKKKTEDPVPDPVPDPVQKQLPDRRHGTPQLHPGAPRR